VDAWGRGAFKGGEEKLGLGSREAMDLAQGVVRGGGELRAEILGDKRGGGDIH